MHTILRWTFCSLLVLFGLAGFSRAADGAASPASAFQRMAASADPYFSAGTKEITADELWAELNDADTTAPYVISVCLLADDTARGHIPGAHHWDPASIVRHRDQLPTDKKIVVYCYTGQSSSACTAFLNLAGLNAYNLRWGLCAWTADTSDIGMGGGWYHPTVGHQKLETQPHSMTAEYRFPEPKAKTGPEVVDLFCANVEPQVAKPTKEWKLKSANDVYANIEDPDTTNDWFVLFCGPETVYQAGHIPGAYYLNTASMGPDESLKYLPTDRPIVVYCMNGNHSMQVVTLLNALGYDAYSLKRGLGAITDSPEILGPFQWTPAAQNRPLIPGPLPVY
jgi:rhodanese-related sulfurtransferase